MNPNFEGLKLADEPRPEWLRVLPGVTVDKINAKGQNVSDPYQYLPIEIVEALLAHFFRRNRIEILREGILANSVSLTVRVHAFDPELNEWTFHDGIGAAMIPTAPRMGCVDFNYMLPSGVMTGAPAAKSFAIKNACQGFGNIFGGNVNRSDIDAFVMTPKQVGDEPPPKTKKTAKQAADAMVSDLKDKLKIQK